MQKTRKLEIDEYEQGILINALNLLRNQQIREKRPTDPIDDLIISTAYDLALIDTVLIPDISIREFCQKIDLFPLFRFTFG